MFPYWYIGPELVFPWIIFWLGALLDWYTTKRRLVDINLNKIEQGKQPTWKETNPILRSWLRTPSRDDEWKILIFKIIVFPFLWGFGVPPYAYYIIGGFSLFAAANNKWNIIGKIFG